MNTLIEKGYKKISFYLKRGVHFLYALAKPKSKNEDRARREFILNILLLSSVLFSLAMSFIALVDMLKDKLEYSGVSPFVPLVVSGFFAGLYVLSRKGFSIFASYLFINTYFLSIVYMVFNWGIDIPQGVLSYALIIVISGILINTRFAFLMTGIISTLLLVIIYLQERSFIKPDVTWRAEIAGSNDVIGFIVTLGIIVIVSWLSNREIEKSLKRARRSEAELKKERDFLEVKVDERTQELKHTQIEKTLQLYRFAEFGKMTSELYHDIVNPLTAVSLNLESLKDNKEKECTIKSRIEGALMNMKQVFGIISGARQQIQKQEFKTNFSPSKEIQLALQMLSLKAHKVGVEFVFTPRSDIELYGNSIKFYRLAIDLVTNAIDAYEHEKYRDTVCRIRISLEQKEHAVELVVEDRGCGIAQEHLPKIFEPLFTTKGSDKGTGIGLSIVKHVVENDFNGSIKVFSLKDDGARFEISFPRSHK